jgi:hypothetical protein
MRQVGFAKEVEMVEKYVCPMCMKDINMRDFKDNLSVKEYRISGLCQNCQDKIFAEE